MMTDIEQLEVEELEAQLATLFGALVLCLTPRQREVVELSFAGLTQHQIAISIGITQSSVCKTIKGQFENGVWYGGVGRKLAKLARANSDIRRVVSRLDGLHAYETDRHLTYYRAFRRILGEK